MRILRTLFLALSSLSPTAMVQSQTTAPGAVPIPPAERGLPVIVADRPIVVPGATKDLEGPVFLPDGTLLFSDVQGGRVMRLDRTGRVSVVVRLDGLMPGGMALAPDGRLHIAAANASGSGGVILSMATDGTEQRIVVPASVGMTPNDVVFDTAGGFYITDARGTIGDPAGGVWYVPPGGAPAPVVRHLAVANGVALSPDGKRLWIGEYALGRLYRVDLKDATTPEPYGAVTVYHFTGPAPDSMRVDAQGRVYVCLYGQGRILIFSPTGLPVAQIVLPGRDGGRNLSLTSLAIRPGTDEVAIVTSDGQPGGTATIFHARLPAP